LKLALTRGKKGVELRDLSTNAKIAEPCAESSNSECWAFSRDGSLFAVGDLKGDILLWSASPAKHLVTLSGHSAAVTSVSFSAEGGKLVSGSDDTTIVVWDVRAWTVPAVKGKAGMPE
jgi:WD40 repeat protein